MYTLIFLKIWNLLTFKRLHLIEGYGGLASYLELTSDQNFLSFSNNITVELWHTETGKLLKSNEFEDRVFCFKILNEDLIAVGLYDGSIKIYNINNMIIVITILAHESAVKELILLKNGCLISQSDDGEIKLWKILDNN